MVKNLDVLDPLSFRYGGEEHMEAPRELIFSQNENYVEYLGLLDFSCWREVGFVVDLLT